MKIGKSKKLYKIFSRTLYVIVGLFVLDMLRTSYLVYRVEAIMDGEATFKSFYAIMRNDLISILVIGIIIGTVAVIGRVVSRRKRKLAT